ncbi:class I adenylate-forming enzyme family protein [Archaeoglobus neptunius]|uniref:class I adenylate-forming enzyme family protein n=1 Tax=Archaeoglobus neptunius TaxID=2798580 RepID=UPI0019269FD6|nr:class I adenylate-forming enzyme family protein [Archaeoglobus neptunius]
MVPEFDYLWQYLDHWAEIDERFPAIKFKGKEISYGELKNNVDRLAASLLSLGVKKGDRVSTVLPMCPEYVYSFLACSKIGAICVPMDVRYRTAELRKFLRHARPEVVMAAESFQENDIKTTLTEIKEEIGNPEIFFLDSGFEELLKGEPLERVVEQSPDDDILIIFTGGTTGVPKATLLSHRNIISMAIGELKSLVRYVGREERMTTLVHLPPSHVGGTTELLATGVVNGSKMILVDHWRPDTVLRELSEEKITFFGAVPTMFALLFSLNVPLPSVELLVTAGEKLNPELLRRMVAWCEKVGVGYGSTETAGFVTFSQPEDDPAKFTEGYVGIPFDGVEIKIVDGSGVELKDGEIGEVLVKGPMVSKGYFNQPEETEKGFRDGYWVSGDLGYKKGEELYIVGRKKEVIRVGSYTVLPSEIEEVVMRNPGVGIAAAFGYPHEIYGEVVWLAVVPKAGEKINEAEIIEACKRELADFKVPRRVLIMDSIPLTRLGKADRIKLKETILKEFSG